VSSLAVLYANWMIPVLPPFRTPTGGEVFALALLIVFNLLILAVLRGGLLTVSRLQLMGMELYPLLMAVWLLINTAAFLVVQFRLSTYSLTVSIIYLLMASGFVYYGLARHYAYIRRFGLVLTALVTAKLFLYDLSFLTALAKIFAYFCFGVALLVISYIYQRLEKGWGGARYEKSP
jgi:hypothetical protein